MIKISNGITNKEVTKGAYENFYKPFGYNIVGEEKKNREVEIKKVDKKDIEDKEEKKSPKVEEFKKR